METFLFITIIIITVVLGILAAIIRAKFKKNRLKHADQETDTQESSIEDELKKLSDLKEQGTLTDKEFVELKAKLFK